MRANTCHYSLSVQKTDPNFLSSVGMSSPFAGFTDRKDAFLTTLSALGDNGQDVPWPRHRPLHDGLVYSFGAVRRLGQGAINHSNGTRSPHARHDETDRQTDKSYGTMRHVRSGKNTRWK